MLPNYFRLAAIQRGKQNLQLLDVEVFLAEFHLFYQLQLLYIAAVSALSNCPEYHAHRQLIGHSLYLLRKTQVQ